MAKLLVPIHIDALVVNNTSPKIKDVKLRYSELLPSNFETKGALGTYLEESKIWLNPNTMSNGIHLHWTLPMAFRKGVAEKDGLTFPLIPNRWLVYRLDENGNGQAWVVESDSTSPEQTFNWAEQEKNTQKLVVKSVGKKTRLQDWQEPNPNELFLTIMAPGNPEFAAAYVHSKNVLGFYDAMEGVGNQATFTYHVFGWFSKPGADILAGVANKGDLIKKLTQLGWDLANKDSVADVPNAILCHSMVHSVVWKGLDATIGNQIPSRGDIKLGIGNSTSEAMAALLKNKIAGDQMPVPQQLLSAFQYKKLEEQGLQKDGSNLLKKQMKDRGFYQVNGGTHWIIEPKEKKPHQSMEGKELEKAPFPTAISNDLALLINTQAEFDDLGQKLVGYQRELYDVKFRQTLINVEVDENIINSLPDVDAWAAKVMGQMEASVNTLKANILNTSNRLKDLKSPVANAPSTAFEVANKGIIVDIYKRIQAAMLATPAMKDYELKEVNNASFFRATEPTLVIDGVKPAERYLSQNQDSIKCRTLDTAVKNIKIAFGGYNYTITPNDLGISFSLGAKSPIPAEIEVVLKESLLLNPMQASRIAAKVSNYAGSTCTPAQVLPLITSYNAANYEGSLPATFSLLAWQQPWIPLYMEWAIRWTGDKSGANKYDMYGRTLLSGDMVNKVAGLNQKLNTQLFQTMRPMAQTLSGFSEQLIGRYNGIQLPIFKSDMSPDPDNALIGSQAAWSPMPNKKTFLPLRGVYFEVINLRVIDAFGQVLKVIGEMDGVTSPTPLQKSSALLSDTVGGRPNFFLPTRILQPTRLRLDWISAKHTDGRITHSDIATTPINGWLLLDKLDNSIEVYDADGLALGELMKVGANIKFVPPIGTKKAKINDPKLNAIVQKVVGNENAFNALCTEIDKLNQKVAAKASRQNFIMGLPIGFPIAVASAKCKLELQGNPIKHNYWAEDEAVKGWENTSFTCNVGDAKSAFDGLLGYFMGGNYDKMIVPFDYTKGVNLNPYLDYDAKLSVKINTSYDLTLLIDPRMGVNLETEVLPQQSCLLPNTIVEKALEKINLSFLAAPVITPVTKVKMPLMDSKDMTWQWIEKVPGLSNETITSTPDSNDNGRLSFEPLHAVEGWLKLVKKPK